MANDREINYVLKATDQSKQTLQETVALVKQLTATLAEQVKASQSGAAAAGEFSRALGDVKKVGAELSAQKIAVDDFGGKTDRLDNATAKLRDATAARAAYIESLPNSTELTKKQISELERLERTVNSAEKALTGSQKAYDKSGAGLARAGIETANLSEANKLLTATLAGVADALNAASVADLQFLTNRKQAIESESRAAEITRDNAEVERIRATGRAAQARVDKAAEEARIKALYDERDARLAVAAAQEKQAAELARLRALSQEVASRVAATLPASPLPPPPDTLQDRIRQRLVTPGQQEAQQSPLGDKSTVLGNYGEVLRINGEITAAQKSVGSYRKELEALTRAEQELVRQAGVVDGFERQLTALEASAKALREAHKEVRRLNAAVQDAPNAVVAAEATSKLGKAELSVAQASSAHTAQQQRYDQERRALEAIGVAVNEVGAAQIRLTQTASSATEARIAQEERERISLQNLVKEAGDRAAAIQAQVDRQKASGGLPQSRTGTSGVRDVLAQIPNREDAGGGALGGRSVDEALHGVEKVFARGTTSGQVYNRQLDIVYAAQRKLANDTALIESFQKQEVSVHAAEKAFAAADAELKKVTADAKNYAATAHEVTSAEAKFGQAGAELQRQVATQQSLSAELRKRKIDITNLDEETKKLTASANRLVEVQRVAGDPSSGKIFGLDPYKFKNLEYQIGDVYTQLSLGQGFIRTFESQADQIFQIFDYSALQFKRMILFGAPAIATIYLVVASLVRFKEQVEAIRTLDARLTANVDGVTTNAKAMFEAQKYIQGYGASFKEAGEAVAHFFEAGVQPERIREFGRAAQDMVDVYGKKLPEATKEISTAFTGNYDAIKKLDEQYNFLTATLRAQVKAFFDEGHSIEGRNLAFDAFIKQQDAAADKSRTGWTLAVRELKTAWDELLITWGRTGALSEIAKYFAEILQTATAISKLLKGEMNLSTFNENIGRIGRGEGLLGQNQEQLRVLQEQRGRLAADLADMDGTNAPDKQAVGKPEDLAAMRAKIAELDNRIAVLSTGASVENLEQERARLLRERDELRNKGDVVGITESRPNTTSNPGVPESYSRLRDAIADKVGLDREALARVQRVEGVYVNGKWAHSPTGVTGPMQVTEATFAELKRRYADITGGIDDIASNTLAGAYLLREKLQRSAGNLPKAYAAYNTVPAEYTRSNAALYNGVSINGYSGTALTTPGSSLAAVEARIAEIGKKLAEVTSDGRRDRDPSTRSEPGSNLPAAQEATQRQEKRGQDFVDYVEKQLAGMRDRNLRGPEALARDKRELKQYRDDLNQEAAKDGGNANSRENQAKIDEAVALKEKILTEAREKRDKAERDKDQSALEALQNQVNAIKAKVDKNDKTNIGAQLRAIDEEYDKINATIRKAKDRGMPTEELQAQADKARAELKDQAVVAATEAILQKTLDERALVYKKIAADLASGAISFATAAERANAANERFAPRVKEAQERALSALRIQGGTTPSQAVQTAIEKVGDAKPNDAAAQRAIFDKGYSQLEEIQKTRATVRATQTELQQNGLQSREGAEATIARVYEKTRVDAENLTKSLRDQLEVLHNVGSISEEAYQRLSAGLTKAAADTQYVSGFQKQLSKTIDDSVVSHALRGFDLMAQSLGNLAAGTGKIGDVFRSAGQAAAEFAAGVLKDIAQMILKYEVLALVQSAIGKPGAEGASGTGGQGDGAASGIAGLLKMGASYLSGGATNAFDKLFGGSITGGGGGGGGGIGGLGGLGGGGGGGSDPFAGAGVSGSSFGIAHGGAIVGSATMSRMIDPAVFDYARRYHRGGTVGLSSDEVPTILQRGEEVITKADSRHAGNGGRNAAKEVTSERITRNVLVLDPKDLSTALAGSHGEDVVISHIKNNAQKVNSMLGN